MTLFESNAPLSRALAFAVSLSAILVAANAAAQPTPVPPGDQNPAPVAPPPITPSQITGQPTGDDKVVQDSHAVLGVIERLPDTAYPTYPIRGLYGGSLWATFHGLQWPYYPKTGIGVSGYVWIDSGYAKFNIGAPSQPDQSQIIQTGRALLRITPTWSDGQYFVQGQAEIVANRNQQQTQPIVASADDVWVKLGRWNSWDVQVGRFEAWEVYHFGMGLDLYSFDRDGAAGAETGGPQVPIYGLTYAFYRSSSVGQGAIHFYPSKNLRFELGSEFGSANQNTLAVRPVGVYDLGWLKLKAGGEYVASNDTTTGLKGSSVARGVGGAVQFVADPYVEFGVSAAYGLIDINKSDAVGTYDAADSNTTYSVGAFLNGRPLPGVLPDLLIGLGYDYTYLENQEFDSTLGRHGKFRHQQTFVAVQYYLWKQLMIKAVAGYARADLAPTFVPPPSLYTNELLSARLRLEYLF